MGQSSLVIRLLLKKQSRSFWIEKKKGKRVKKTCGNRSFCWVMVVYSYFHSKLILKISQGRA